MLLCVGYSVRISVWVNDVSVVAHIRVVQPLLTVVWECVLNIANNATLRSCAYVYGEISMLVGLVGKHSFYVKD